MGSTREFVRDRPVNCRVAPVKPGSGFLVFSKSLIFFEMFYPKLCCSKRPVLYSLRCSMAEEGHEFILDLVEQLRADNGGKLPSAKKVAESFGCSQKEAKEILQEYKDLQPPAQKKQKKEAPEEAGRKDAVPAPAVNEQDAFPQVEEPGAGDSQDVEVPGEEAEEAEGEVEETLVDVPEGGFADLEDEPLEDLNDRQPDGPSPLKGTTPGSQIDRANTQRPSQSLFCFAGQVCGHFAAWQPAATRAVQFRLGRHDRLVRASVISRHWCVRLPRVFWEIFRCLGPCMHGA